MKISIIGTGYVGLVSGVGFAQLGNNVICVDVDKKKVEDINNGIPPIYEDGLKDLLSKNKERLTATTDYKFAIEQSDITFICVGTPSQDDGSIDLSYIEEVSVEIGKQIRNKKSWHLVVVKSTVLPGTSEKTVLPLLEQYSGKKAGKDFGVVMCPEFLKEGVAIKDFFEPDRIVIGFYDKHSLTVLRDLYKDFSCPLVETSLSAAEMIKYASNAFLATKISFINEIGNMCKSIGINTYEVADGMGLDKRIGRAFLNAGVGWGGSCFPKDVHALIAWAKKRNESSRILDNVVEVNRLQPLKLIKLLKKQVPEIQGKTIGVLGLAFKPNTDDIRESRALVVIKELLNTDAVVKVYDPEAMENCKSVFPDITYCDTAEEVLTADAILILTDWDEFSCLDYTGKIIIDGRNVEKAKEGIYEGICW